MPTRSAGARRPCREGLAARGPYPRGAWGRLGLLVAAAGCAPPTRLELEPVCDPRALAPGEVRVRRLRCSDDRVSGGEGNTGDWILENNKLRAVFREASSALTAHGVGGGTLVDLISVGASSAQVDVVVEVLPQVAGGGWLRAVVLEPLDEGQGWAGLALRGLDGGGAEHSLRWTLDADSDRLVLDPPLPLEVVPWADDLQLGSTLEVSDELSAGSASLLGVDGALDVDLGGRVHFGESGALTAGDRAALAGALGWEVEIDVLSDGEWVWGLDAGGRALARLAVSADGAAVGLMPPGVERLIATRSGHANSEIVDVEPGLNLRVGDRGALTLEAREADGSPVSAQIHVEKIDPDGVFSEGRWWAVPGGAALMVGPGTYSGWIDAGPAFEPQRFGPLEVRGPDEVRLSARLTRAGGDEARLAALADLDLRAWPDRGTRRGGTTAAADAAAQGVRWLGLSAGDEIAQLSVDSYTRGLLKAQAGSAAEAPAGTVWSWPWGPDAEQAAHGAVDPTALGPLDLLAAVSVDGLRFTMVDTGWVAQAGDPLWWDPVPDAIFVEGLHELPAIARLADLGLPVAVVGPRVWLVGEDERRMGGVDAERAVHERRTVASNGPLLLLQRPSPAPGGPLPQGRWARLRLRCPTTTRVSRVALIGPAGELASWAVNPGRPSLDVSLVLPDVPWVIAIAEGADATPPLQPEPPWAMSSPLMLR